MTTKPRHLIVDFHGVIADLITAMQKVKAVEVDADTLAWEDPLLNGVWDWLKQGVLYEHMPVYPGAVEFFGATTTEYLTIASNSPQEAYPLMQAWLVQNGIAYRNLWLGADKRKPAKEDCHNILIEDNWDNAVNFASSTGPAILLDRPWNRDKRYPTDVNMQYDIQRVYSWSDTPYVANSLFATMNGIEEVATPSNVLSFPGGGVREAQEELRYDLISPEGMRRLARAYSEGAKKYTDRNWEKGIPFSNLYWHMAEHQMKWLEGDTEEDHLAHAAWGLFALMHFERWKPEMDDIHEGGDNDN